MTTITPDRRVSNAIHSTEKDGAAMQALLDRGVDPNESDDDRWTLLHWAAVISYPPVVKVLLSAGADPSLVDIIGQTPLHIAVANNQVAVVQALLDAGAAPNARDNDGETPLHRAARRPINNPVAVVQALLAAGADPVARNEAGQTASDLVPQGERLLVAALLEQATRQPSHG